MQITRHRRHDTTFVHFSLARFLALSLSSRSDWERSKLYQINEISSLFHIYFSVFSIVYTRLLLSLLCCYLPTPSLLLLPLVILSLIVCTMRTPLPFRFKCVARHTSTVVAVRKKKETVRNRNKIQFQGIHGVRFIENENSTSETCVEERRKCGKE